MSNIITCDVCGESRVRSEPFLDLGLRVKDLAGVADSLATLFEIDHLTGENKLTCDSAKCKGTKTDSRKYQRVGKLPPVLTLGLYRFELDYTTWQRYKINDRFEYPLELDMRQFIENPDKVDPEDSQYELKSIIIHRGSAYGGHYYAYIHDDLGQGNWHLQKQENFES